MALGRTQFKYSRIYMDNTELACYVQTFGPLVWEFGEIDATLPMCDASKGYFPDQATITPTMINGVMDPTAYGYYDTFKAPGSSSVFTAAIGIRAAPAQGDPVYVGRFQRVGGMYGDSGGLTMFNIPMGDWDGNNRINYKAPWGWLLKPHAAVTAVNSSTGIDDYGAATAYGGYMIYHVTGGDGTATIKVQDAATNSDGSFADLSGATTGSVNWNGGATGGIVAIGNTATVRRYLRWQIVLGTATTVSFILSFVRGTSAT